MFTKADKDKDKVKDTDKVKDAEKQPDASAGKDEDATLGVDNKGGEYQSVNAYGRGSVLK